MTDQTRDNEGTQPERSTSDKGIRYAKIAWGAYALMGVGALAHLFVFGAPTYSMKLAFSLVVGLLFSWTTQGTPLMRMAASGALVVMLPQCSLVPFSAAGESFSYWVAAVVGIGVGGFVSVRALAPAVERRPDDDSV